MYVDVFTIIETCFIYSLSTIQVKFMVWRVYNKKTHTEIARLEDKSRQYVTHQITDAFKKLASL